MSVSILVLIIFSFVAANLPWLSERFLIVLSVPDGGSKKIWMRLLEWCLFCTLSILLAWGLEQKLTGSRHPQDWEFYAIFVCLFAVFAFPGFVYRHMIQPLLSHKSLNNKQ